MKKNHSPAQWIIAGIMMTLVLLAPNVLYDLWVTASFQADQTCVAVLQTRPLPGTEIPADPLEAKVAERLDAIADRACGDWDFTERFNLWFGAGVIGLLVTLVGMRVTATPRAKASDAVSTSGGG